MAHPMQHYGERKPKKKPFRIFIGKHPCDDLPYINGTDPDPRSEEFESFLGIDGDDYSGWYVREDG